MLQKSTDERSECLDMMLFGHVISQATEEDHRSRLAMRTAICQALRGVKRSLSETKARKT